MVSTAFSANRDNHKSELQLCACILLPSCSSVFGWPRSPLISLSVQINSTLNSEAQTNFKKNCPFPRMLNGTLALFARDKVCYPVRTENVVGFAFCLAGGQTINETLTEHATLPHFSILFAAGPSTMVRQEGKRVSLGAGSRRSTLSGPCEKRRLPAAVPERRYMCPSSVLRRIKQSEKKSRRRRRRERRHREIQSSQ